MLHHSSCLSHSPLLCKSVADLEGSRSVAEGEGAIKMRRRSAARNGDGEEATAAMEQREKNPGAEEDPDAEAVSEFGGPLGCVLIMLFSHATVYYIWICLEYYGASLAYPSSLADVGPFLGRMAAHLADGAAPSWYAASLYVTFVAFQALLAATMPGVMTKGLPVPSEGNRQLLYNCNGVYSWYATLATVAALHYFHIFRLSEVIVHLGAITTCSIIFSDILSVAVRQPLLPFLSLNPRSLSLPLPLFSSLSDVNLC